MKGIRNKIYICVIIVIQVTVASLLGVFSIYMANKNSVPTGIYIGPVYVGDLSKSDAKKELTNYYSKLMESGSLKIRLDDGYEKEIGFKSINAYIDIDKSIDKVSNWTTGQGILNILSSHVLSKKQNVTPVIKLDENILISKITELASIIDKEPVSASIYLKDGTIKKFDNIVGYKLNIGNALKKVLKGLNDALEKPIEFKASNNYEITAVSSEIDSKDIEGADDVISEYATQIKPDSLLESIKNAALAINRIALLPGDKKKGNKPGVFSFIKCMTNSNLDISKEDNGLEQVASTLYAALLNAGMENSNINRTPHKTPVTYIEPGLDAVINDKTDLKFENTTTNPIVIFAEVNNDQVKVSIIGKKRDDSVSSLMIDVIQKFEPSIINLENPEMKSGEKKLLTKGKEGIKVDIYRVIKSGNEDEKKILIKSEKYEATETLMQTGPIAGGHRKSAK